MYNVLDFGLTAEPQIEEILHCADYSAYSISTDAQTRHWNQKDISYQSRLYDMADVEGVSWGKHVNQNPCELSC
jgi:hypothetical protein